MKQNILVIFFWLLILNSCSNKTLLGEHRAHYLWNNSTRTTRIFSKRKRIRNTSLWRRRVVYLDNKERWRNINKGECWWFIRRILFDWKL